ncbi:mechanosensitive ion channel family protein [Acuticoccus sp. I52.16.1]|uniref:mechanosensitive ion channel family protein n=1 Tax=Acuticoccus sp. I52.16.1 TaxID=2928472 RepID=UPI001FCF8FF4|nr:mechanosensitive ion channel family protein [Acuticoccus sp. I52.16.1]UOM34284.1 mechanosensitive ion channel family protein [Acuticoccus sp. I52.16.1]
MARTRLAATALLAFLLLSSAAVAQIRPGSPVTPPPAAAPSDVDAALTTLRGAGYTVLIAPPAEVPAAAGAGGPDIGEVGEAISAGWIGLKTIFAEAPSAPDRIVRAMEAAGGGSLAWTGPALLLAAVAVGAGALAFLLTERFLGRLWRTIGTTPLDRREGRILWTMGAFARSLAATAALTATGALVTLLAQPVRSPVQVTGLHVVAALGAFLVLRAILVAILAPGNGAARIVPLGDPFARSLYRQLSLAGLLGIAVSWFCFWLAYFPLEPRSHQLLLVLAPTVSVVMFALPILAHRQAVRAAILGAAEPPGAVRRTIALAWPALALTYLAGAWLVNIGEITTRNRLIIGPATAPVLAIAFGLFVLGVLLLFHDRRLAPTIAASAWTGLYEGFARGVAAIAAFALLGALWRVYGTPWGEAYEVGLALALMLLLAWVGWGAVRNFVNARLEAEQEAHGPAVESEGEGMGPGATRLETLLPIFRNLMAFVILAVSVMVFLSVMGVSVAPLFAGAGVAGLAIGFGAQALIRDMFSGAFFLLDDAFRRGEYVEVSGTAGMVEKISVRSFQLRHHSGPLHTIPFGEIKQLTNYSRDWVIMKLPVRLTYDTDVEQVRKLVKKLGLEMAENPEYGHLFLEPPKSQGVIQMDDSAMILRIKFKTKPGDQFVLRRHVYQRVRDVFTENGIRFAHREVTVRVADASDEETRRQAALGAVREGAVDAAPKGVVDTAAW